MDVAKGNAVTSDAMRCDAMRCDTDDDVCVSRDDDDAGETKRIRRTMNENATRGRNVPGGMKEGTSFLIDASARARTERGETD